jgi:hypothetical protein
MPDERLIPKQMVSPMAILAIICGYHHAAWPLFLGIDHPVKGTRKCKE